MTKTQFHTLKDLNCDRARITTYWKHICKQFKVTLGHASDTNSSKIDEPPKNNTFHVDRKYLSYLINNSAI